MNFLSFIFKRPNLHLTFLFLQKNLSTAPHPFPLLCLTTCEHHCSAISSEATMAIATIFSSSPLSCVLVADETSHQMPPSLSHRAISDEANTNSNPNPLFSLSLLWWNHHVKAPVRHPCNHSTYRPTLLFSPTTAPKTTKVARALNIHFEEHVWD